jgi:hypothetical protein
MLSDGRYSVKIQIRHFDFQQKKALINSAYKILE